MGKKSVVPGLVLIIVGLWFLLESLGYEWVSMDRLWPVVMVVVVVSPQSASLPHALGEGVLWYPMVNLVESPVVPP